MAGGKTRYRGSSGSGMTTRTSTITPPGKDTLLWKARKGGVVIAEYFNLQRLLDDLETP